MERAPRLDGDEIRSYRLAIGEEYSDADMSRFIAGIENASGLVRDQRRIRERALRWNVTFRYGPTICPSAVIFAARVCCGVELTAQAAPQFRGRNFVP
jgi:hypothetical protein